MIWAEMSELIPEIPDNPYKIVLVSSMGVKDISDLFISGADTKILDCLIL